MLRNQTLKERLIQRNQTQKEKLILRKLIHPVLLLILIPVMLRNLILKERLMLRDLEKLK